MPSKTPLENKKLARAKGRIAVLQGCAEPVLRPEIQNAAVRLINRLDFGVCFVENEVCCGALVHHLGQDSTSLEAAQISALAKDISEWLSLIGIPTDEGSSAGKGVVVAYHGACSLQHGQKILQQAISGPPFTSVQNHLSLLYIQWNYLTGQPATRSQTH